MEFGSEYVYQYDDSDEESVSDGEYENGLDDIRYANRRIYLHRRSLNNQSEINVSQYFVFYFSSRHL